jgi:hypothetical protein
MRVVLIVAITTLASAFAASGTAAPTACGPQQVGNVTVRTFCGPAKATVKWAGRTLTIKGGQCEISKVFGKAYFTINTGRYTVPPATPKASSFSAVQGNSDPLKPGTQTSWLITFQTPGKQWLLLVSKLLPASTTKVTILTKGAKKATFAGKLDGGGSVTGSWTC